ELSLEENGLALADSYTERRQPVVAAAAAQLVEQRDHQARPAHPQRMPDRDRAAVHVYALRIELKLANDDEALRREGLVQLDEIDVARIDARPLEQLPHRRNRPNPHDLRIDPRDRAADERAERPDAERGSPLFARDHERRGPVVDSARVTPRHRAVLPESRLEGRELLRARVRTGMLVPAHSLHLDELVVEAPSFLGRGPALLRTQRELVLLVSRAAVALGDILARLAHRLEREHGLHARVRKSPAERRVPDGLVPAREPFGRLRHDERGAAHRLDAAGNEEIDVTRSDRVT